jgi:hypothetical protein
MFGGVGRLMFDVWHHVRLSAVRGLAGILASFRCFAGVEALLTCGTDTRVTCSGKCTRWRVSLSQSRRPQ